MGAAQAAITFNGASFPTCYGKEYISEKLMKWAEKQGVRGKGTVLVPLPAPVSKWGIGFGEPEPWNFDGCKRREPVLDDDRRPPAVVRSVVWRVCLKCATPFFSADVIKVRLCYGCKNQHVPRELARLPRL